MGINSVPDFEAKMHDIAKRAADNVIHQAARIAAEAAEVAAVSAARLAAVEAAKEAVKQTLALIGLDINDPVKLQTDFAALRSMMRDEDHMEDMMFLRRLRKTSTAFSNRVGLVVITLAITTIGGMLAFGLRAWLGVFPPPH